MNMELTIIWHKDEPIAFWFGEKLIWETDKTMVEIVYPGTKISLPLIAAIKFSMIFLRGLASDRLLVLLTTLQMKINELKSLSKPVEIKNGNDFYCDKECNRTCDDWDKCYSENKMDDEDEWENFEDDDECN